jgi:hypothetical protein
MKVPCLSPENALTRPRKAPRHWIQTCVLLAFLLLIAAGNLPSHASGLQTKTAALITADPHYRLLMENASLRVFSLTLPPGSQSFIRPEHNYITVTLADCDPIMWSNDESAIQHFQIPQGEVHFFFGGSAHGIRNDSGAEYRNVTIEFLDPRVTTYGYRYESGKYDYGAVALNPPVDPEGHFVNSLNLEKAEAKDVQLLPKESLPAAAGPQLLVAITQSTFSSANDSTISLKPGEVLWREAGAAAMPNNSTTPVRLAVIEFNTSDKKY